MTQRKRARPASSSSSSTRRSTSRSSSPASSRANPRRGSSYWEIWGRDPKKKSEELLDTVRGRAEAQRLVNEYYAAFGRRWVVYAILKRTGSRANPGELLNPSVPASSSSSTRRSASRSSSPRSSRAARNPGRWIYEAWKISDRARAAGRRPTKIGTYETAAEARAASREAIKHVSDRDCWTTFATKRPASSSPNPNPEEALDKSTRRSNPAGAISGKLPAHEVTTLPNQAVLLGVALELEVKQIGKANHKIQFRGEECALLSDADGDALALVIPAIVTEADPKLASREAKNTWRRWSEFEVDGALLLDASDAPLKHYIGRAVSIAYRSDKWTGKAVDYVHKFESEIFQCWANAAPPGGRPDAILISAFPPRRLVTARGIVG